MRTFLPVAVSSHASSLGWFSPLCPRWLPGSVPELFSLSQPPRHRSQLFSSVGSTNDQTNWLASGTVLQCQWLQNLTLTYDATPLMVFLMWQLPEKQAEYRCQAGKSMCFRGLAWTGTQEANFHDVSLSVILWLLTRSASLLHLLWTHTT